MNDKLWIATEGNYSDYRVIAGFDDEKKASEYCKAFGYVLEEVEKNPEIPVLPDGYLAYWIEMDSGGAVLRAECWSKQRTLREFKARDFPEWPNGKYFDGRCSASVLAKSETQAIKIVNDKRREMIALSRLEPGADMWPKSVQSMNRRILTGTQEQLT